MFTGPLYVVNKYGIAPAYVYFSFFVSTSWGGKSASAGFGISSFAPSSPASELMPRSGDTGSDSASDGVIVGLECWDLLCASASSLRRASSSRSNLIIVRECWWTIPGNLLSSKDLDVEPSSVPHAHTEYEQQVRTRPKR